ncbi:Sulfate permease 2 [Cyphellophora attinorum]|uniref:Sulfate permease 2 n=1 Tax=Cyphellophora attinorum TaxID=1664694 RepID=A0A0N1NZT5_9EURO|nr:Sulfate permease 2 [Phialophora attinorum]KPI37894.1 Sulfate permease 2 [Phialophora attinorum]
MPLQKYAHSLARILGIELVEQPHLREVEESLIRVLPHPYYEPEPTVGEYLRTLAPTKRGVATYIHDLFPSAQWLPRYNWRWLLGDAIAGLTIGFVVVPQAMAYALLAQLSPEFGLYTSFTGAATYFLFGTSKDIVIGRKTTAVGSLLVGSVITSVEERQPNTYSRPEVAKALSFIIGLILLLVGLLRLGWLIEFILIVILDTLEGVPRVQLDAAVGLTCLAMLFVVRDVCAKLEIKQPSRKRLWATVSSLRLTFAMLFFTLISFLVHRSDKEHHRFRLVGKINSGFKEAGLPRLEPGLVKMILPELPAIIIILVIEHIAIAKSFGRTFGYTVVPSQEILAQGTANLLGPFIGATPARGLSVRQPAFVLILALYALTGVFYYIPQAALAALIIHATYNLMTPPKSLYKYWQISPFELLIWIAGVTLALFTNLETSIYCTIALSLALLLVRLARARGRFLARIRVGRLAVDVHAHDDSGPLTPSHHTPDSSYRDAFLPSDRKDASNPEINAESPYPGVFVYRFTEGFNYVNQARQMDGLIRQVMAETRPTTVDDGIRPSDRLWNDPGPIRAGSKIGANKPVLRAIVLDCSPVNNTDITSVQGLIDARNLLDKHAAPAVVEWHFANVGNRWTRRALATAGFGFPVEGTDRAGQWAPVFTVSRWLAGATTEDLQLALREGGNAETAVDEERCGEKPTSKGHYSARSRQSIPAAPDDSILQNGRQSTPPTPVRDSSPRLVFGMDRPFFHIDLLEAVDAAVRDAKRADSRLTHVVAAGRRSGDNN